MRQRKQQQLVAWMIKEPGGQLVGNTYFRRSDALKDLIDPTSFTWKKAYKIGWRAVKVSITEVNKYGLNE